MIKLKKFFCFLFNQFKCTNFHEITWDGKSVNIIEGLLDDKDYNILNGDKKNDGTFYTEEKILYIDMLGGYVSVGTKLQIMKYNDLIFIRIKN